LLKISINGSEFIHILFKHDVALETSLKLIVSTDLLN